MAIINSNGIVTFSSVPVTAPTTNGPTFGRLEDTNTFYYWNGSAWVTTTISPSSATVPIEYKVNAIQASTNAPIVSAGNLGINTLGETPVFAYSGAGIYTLTTVAPIFTGKTIVVATPWSSSAAFKINHAITSTTVLTFSAFDDAGVAVDVAGSFSVSIEIYPS